MARTASVRERDWLISQGCQGLKTSSTAGSPRCRSRRLAPRRGAELHRVGLENQVSRFVPCRWTLLRSSTAYRATWSAPETADEMLDRSSLRIRVIHPSGARPGPVRPLPRPPPSEPMPPPFQKCLCRSDDTLVERPRVATSSGRSYLITGAPSWSTTSTAGAPASRGDALGAPWSIPSSLSRTAPVWSVPNHVEHQPRHVEHH